MTTNFLKLLFDPGEEICVSPNKYGYHSINQEAINRSISLVSPNQDCGSIVIEASDINLIAVNPIKGFRTDANVTAFRSFMIEIDTGPLQEQKRYIEESKLPFSACIFSGNKSLHYVIALDEPLSDIHQWRFYNQWLLNCLPKTDQQIKNPSRSLRFPGNKRHNGRELVQAMVEMRSRVSREDFFRWLFSHESKKPVQRREQPAVNPRMRYKKIPFWLVTKLKQGVYENRNGTWFQYACNMANSGFNEEETINYFSEYFLEDRDFKQKEFESCIKSAFKHVAAFKK